MKTTKVFALLVGALVSLSTYSQDKHWTLGLELGAGMTNFYGNEFIEEYAMPRAGFTGGVSGSYYFTRNFSLKSGLLFEQKGDRSDVIVTDDQGNQLGQATSTASFNFLVVPLLAKFETGNNLSFFINGGPYAGLLLNHTMKTKAPGISPLVAKDPHEFRRFEFGLAAGVGAMFPISDNIRFSLEARHNRGLSDLQPAGSYNTGALRSHSTSLMAGLVYNL